MASQTPKLSDPQSIGTAGTNQVTTITLTGGPTGGDFTVTVDGQTTAAQAYNVSAANLDTAIEGLSSVGADELTVTRSGAGSAGNPYVYTLTFSGTLAATAVTVTANGAGLTGGTAPAATVATATAAVERAAGVAQVSQSNLIAVQLVYTSDAAGAVTIHGSLEPAASATNFDTIATDTAVASTTALVHLVDLPVSALKVDSTAMTAGRCTATYSVWA